MVLLIACRIYLWSWQFHQSVIYIFEVLFHFEILVHFFFVFICLLFTLNSVVLNIFYCWLWLFDVPPCSMDLSELFVFFFASRIVHATFYWSCNSRIFMHFGNNADFNSVASFQYLFSILWFSYCGNSPRR